VGIDAVFDISGSLSRIIAAFGGEGKENRLADHFPGEQLESWWKNGP
jgi:hypothetical protein